MMSDELLGITDAAQIAGVSAPAVRYWTDRGLLPCVRTRRGMRLIRRTDLLALIENRARNPRRFNAGGRLLSISAEE